MRRTIMSVAALAATLLLPLAAHTPLAQGKAQPAAAAPAFARVIVKYRADSDLLKKQALTATGTRILQAHALGDRIGVALTAGIGITNRSHVVTASGLTSSTLAAKIAALEDVEYAVVDARKHIVAAPNDQYYAAGPPVGATKGGPVVGQWYLKPPGPGGTALNTAPSAINAEQAWDVATGGSNVVVAVIDTGVRLDHADLQGGNVLPGYDMISDDRTSGDSQPGRDADPSDPGDFVTSADVAANAPGCTQSDVGSRSSWHGTQTLGLIGAATNNNAVGIASTGNGKVKVLPIRALGKCGGFDSDIVAAMYWAAGLSDPAATSLPANPNKANVISMSLGGSGPCDASAKIYTDAIAAIVAQNVSIVVAAGNDSTAVGIPANCPGVIAVAGLRSLGDKNGFSSLGPEVTISAPGGNCGNGDGTGNPSSCLYPIISTSNSGTTTPVANSAGGSIYSDGVADPAIGTSFSTPLVAGTIAMMLSLQPTLTPAEIKALLQASARPFPTSGNTLVTTAPGLCVAPNGQQQVSCYCTTSTCGAGMLDAHAAVLAVMATQARIAVNAATPTAGQVVSLSSNSVVATGATIASYQWAITSPGTSGAILVGAANTATVNVLPSAAGSFTIQLSVGDNFGSIFTTSSVVTVAAAPVAPAPSSGGGGALGVGWLVLLLSAVLALAATARFERRRAALNAPARTSRRR